MNNKVKSILAGIGAAGLLTTSCATGYLVLNQASNYEDKQIYVMNEFNRQMEHDAVSDTDMQKFQEDSTYTGFIKDEEKLAELEQLNNKVAEVNAPVAAAAIIGAVATPLIFVEPKSNEPEPAPEQ